MNREGFVGVHIGAGQHAESRTELYLKICAEACKVAIEELKKGGDALEAACKATMILEDAGETNAGYGSNLTESGTVEMGTHSFTLTIFSLKLFSSIMIFRFIIQFVIIVSRRWNNGWEFSFIWRRWCNAWY